jgi:hypothetical protein
LKTKILLEITFEMAVNVPFEKLPKKLLRTLSYNQWREIFRKSGENNEIKIRRIALSNMARLAKTAVQWREIYWEAKKGSKLKKKAFRGMVD